jgi:hypothetical protein
MKSFKHPYFVTAHAVKRFQEEVTPLNSIRVIEVIQEALQDPGKPIEFERRGGQLCPIFKCEYEGFVYYVPVAKGRGNWPAVPTVHGYGSIIHERIKRGKKKGCGVYEKQS